MGEGVSKIRKIAEVLCGWCLKWCGPSANFEKKMEEFDTYCLLQLPITLPIPKTSNDINCNDHL